MTKVVHISNITLILALITLSCFNIVWLFPLIVYAASVCVIIAIWKYKTVLYQDIDELPMWNWNRVKETGNVIYLLKKNNYKEHNILDKLFLYKKLPKIWDELFDQWIKEFGIDEEYKDGLKEEIELMCMICDRWISDDRSLETFIDIKVAEMKKRNNNANEVKFGKQLSLISKFKGYRIDEKTITVKEFYSDLELYKEHIDAIIKQNRKNKMKYE